MPGRLFLSQSSEDVARAVGARAPGFADPPRLNIAPGQDVAAILPGPKLVRMRWGLIPVGRVNARGRPVMETIVNARSETVFDKTAFAGVRRCVVPAEGWYEWTGEKRRKTAWAIRPKAGGLLYFAAIWDRWEAPGGQVLDQLATVTCAPNADVRDIHDRMGVLLRPENVPVWLNGTDDEARALMAPAPDGSLVVSEAVGVDWSAP